MGLFNSRRASPPRSTAESANQTPVSQIDFHKRYDVYCSTGCEERVYEDVRFVGMRTFDRVSEFTPTFVSGYLEIEATDGSRWMIPTFGIQLICERGTQPVYRVLRRWGNSWDY